MKKFLAICAISALAAANANALTLKKGQVIGGDGGVYDGASPEKIEVLVQRAKDGGDAAGLSGGNVFVIVGDDIAFVPVQDLQGKTKESKMNLIGDKVVETVAGTDALGYEQLQELQEASEMTGVPLEQLMKVDAALSEIPADLAESLTEEIALLVEEGALDLVQEFLNDDLIVDNLALIAEVTAEIEAQFEAGFDDEIDAIELCVGAGGSQATCEALDAKFGEEGEL